MKRREFLAKSALAAVAASVAPAALKAGEPYDFSEQEETSIDPVIVENSVKDGVRYVVATTCAKVCSKQIDIQINTADNTIISCTYTRGCPGNTFGLCSLLKGMAVEEAISRLDGTPCGKRGTSCPDQLARVLKALK